MRRGAAQCSAGPKNVVPPNIPCRRTLCCWLDAPSPQCTAPLPLPQERTLSLFTPRQHIDALAPTVDGNLWVLQHNRGASSLALVSCGPPLQGALASRLHSRLRVQSRHASCPQPSPMRALSLQPWTEGRVKQNRKHSNETEPAPPAGPPPQVNLQRGEIERRIEGVGRMAHGLVQLDKVGGLRVEPVLPEPPPAAV